MQFGLITLISIIACIGYGIIHDQITARICVEYFTIGHPLVVPTHDPTILGVVWGVIATWWVGAILGAVLAIAARIGRRPKRTAQSLVQPILRLLGITAVLAVLAGVVGYVAALNGWIRLVGAIAEDVPESAHIGYLMNIWIHSASYLVSCVGSLVLAVNVWRSRSKYVA